ncbi:MBL fold metallo-hydrolase [Alicyclobacillus acidiphilus]|uniref:MBL fold metallo-hydrolase n=1 Tax=Alicyclobacillus acidiphilus TaxID=182455 RepID=UPI0008353806|nr:MBL fold metallo-hydrolase [Alicyclobacillus acidiphilus]
MGRLIENLYAVAGSGLTHEWDASAYLVAGDEPVLIDCGSTVGYTKLKANLQQIGYAPKDIRKVIATHGHWDHVSGMALLREESDAEFLIHEADRRQVESGDTDKTAAFLYNEPFPKIAVDGLIQDGETLRLGDYDFEVIHTPGHSLGSVSLYTRIHDLGILIVGDTVWGGFHPRIGSDIDKWEQSLDRLLELDFDVFTWGHGQPCLIPEAKVRIQEARRQLGVYFHPWFKPFYRKFTY